MAVQAANSSAITVGGALGMCSDKQYLLGGRSLITEPGEWALDSQAGQLYLWPRDEQAMAAGRAKIVACTTKSIFSVEGESYERAEALAGRLTFDGLQLIGSDFSREFPGQCNCNGQQVGAENRHGMIQITNASDVRVTNCRLRDAGYSGVWLEGW